MHSQSQSLKSVILRTAGFKLDRNGKQAKLGVVKVSR